MPGARMAPKPCPAVARGNYADCIPCSAGNADRLCHSSITCRIRGHPASPDWVNFGNPPPVDARLAICEAVRACLSRQGLISGLIHRRFARRDVTQTCVRACPDVREEVIAGEMGDDVAPPCARAQGGGLKARREF